MIENITAYGTILFVSSMQVSYWPLNDYEATSQSMPHGLLESITYIKNTSTHSIAYKAANIVGDRKSLHIIFRIFQWLFLSCSNGNLCGGSALINIRSPAVSLP